MGNGLWYSIWEEPAECVEDKMHAGNSLCLLGEYENLAFLVGLIIVQKNCKLTEFRKNYAGQSWC